MPSRGARAGGESLVVGGRGGGARGSRVGFGDLDGGCLGFTSGIRRADRRETEGG
jgi:hypothetical protein